jgi:hypothetical protein
MNTELEELKILALEYEDMQKARKAVNNQLAAAGRRGSHDPFLEDALALIKKSEARHGKDLVDAFKRTAPPEIIEFAANTRGIGSDPLLLARLMGEVGDFETYQECEWEKGKKDESKKVRILKDVILLEPRQLWAYCGHGDADLPPVKKGEVQAQAALFAHGNPRAKMIVWNMAVAQVKGRGAYRDYYDQVKAKYAGTKHPGSCVRCGPAGHPAKKGSARSAAHVNAIALRLVGKAILKDLWRVRHSQPAVYGARTPWRRRKVA